MGTDRPQPAPPAPRPRTRRAIPLALAALSLGVMLASGYALAQRLRAYNVQHPRPLYVFKPIQKREFEYAGRHVRIEDHLDEAGRGEVRIAYADDTLSLPVQVPAEHDLPGLQRHRDWLAVLAMADKSGLEASQLDAALADGRAQARLVIVAREVHPGVGSDPLFDVEVDEEEWGWGEVMRRRWTFAFHELLPEGGFRTQRLRFPETARSYNRRVADALRAGEPVPQRDPSELAERTWQYDAALAVSPRPPSITHENQALRNAGWTLPVTSASVIVLVLSLAWAAAPPRRTE